MKKVQMINAYANTKEITIEKYAKYKMDGNEFKILMYDCNHEKYMAIVQEICGALYKIPYQCDISRAELVEELDIDSVPNCILPALTYKSNETINKTILKLIGLVAEQKCQWYSNPHAYFLQNSEYKISQSKQETSELITSEKPTSLPIFECERYIIFNKKSPYGRDNIRKCIYMLHHPTDTINNEIDRDSSISFDPAPYLETKTTEPRINYEINIARYTGYTYNASSAKITEDVNPGTTLVAPLIMPDGTSLTVQALALPCRHEYNIHFAYDVYQYMKYIPELGTARITIDKEYPSDTPKQLFRDGIAKIRNIKIGEKHIEAIDYSYVVDQECDWQQPRHRY